MNVIADVQEKLHLKELRFFTVVAMFFVSVLLISNVASSKILMFGPFELDGGTILFPLSYIFGDVLTEVYGYKRVRKVIWMGVFMNLLMALVFIAVGALPASPAWDGQAAYEMILGWTPRIVLASVIAYFVGEFFNAYIMAKVKIMMKGKWLWVRTMSSTLVGQAWDSGLFVFIAFYGMLPNEVLWTILISNYVFKVGVEFLFTPVTYWVVSMLKRGEGIDVYDYKTNFNPFSLK